MHFVVERKRRDRIATGRSAHNWRPARPKSRPARQTSRYAPTRWLALSGGGRHRLARIAGRVEIDGSKCGQQSPARHCHWNRLSGSRRNSARFRWSRERPDNGSDHLDLRRPRRCLRLGLLVRSRNRDWPDRGCARHRRSNRAFLRTLVQKKTIQGD